MSQIEKQPPQFHEAEPANASEACEQAFSEAYQAQLRVDPEEITAFVLKEGERERIRLATADPMLEIELGRLAQQMVGQQVGPTRFWVHRLDLRKSTLQHPPMLVVPNDDTSHFYLEGRETSPETILPPEEESELIALIASGTPTVIRWRNETYDPAG